MVKVMVYLDVKLDPSPADGIRLTDEDIVESVDMIVAEGANHAGIEV